MSTYSLTHGSEQALGLLLAAGGGEDTLLLRRPENTLHAMLTLQPEGDQVQAFICIGHSRWRQTLQANDPANAQHLADYLEAIANGTADTAETGNTSANIPAYVEIKHAHCRKCGGEAIGYDYATPGPGTNFLYGVKCRHNDCGAIQGYPTALSAADAWLKLQAWEINHFGDPAEKAADHTEQALDMVNHPPHYTGHPSGVECIEIAEHLPFCLGNAFKYLFRRDQKDAALENVEKAIWYLGRHINNLPEFDWTLPEDVHDLLGRVAVHEPYPFSAAMLIIGAPSQCGGYDAAIGMLREHAARLRRGAIALRAA